MHQFRNTEKWILYAAAALLCLALVSFWMTSNIYARYSTEVSGSDSARVAKFKVTEENVSVDTNNLKETFNLAIAPGESQTYRVQVKNESEVAIDYVISAKNQYGNLPLEFVIADVTNVSGSSSDSASTSATAKTASSSETVGTINADDSSAHTYSLTVSWPNDKNSPEYACMTDMLVITLEAKQKD